MKHPTRPPRRASDPLARIAALVLSLVLCACGGGGGGGDDESAVDAPATMSGTVSNGVVIDQSNYTGMDVGVKGSEGTARETSTVSVTTTYSVTLAGLEAPYLLSSNVLDGVRLFAPATTDGTANLTPLTTLLVAWIVGKDPTIYFDITLTGQGGVPAFTDADVAAAQAEVTRYLDRVLGVKLAADTVAANWVTETMDNAPGDPMFDQVVALNRAIAAAGSSLAQLAIDVADQKQRCGQANLAVSGSIASRFCQQDGSSRFSDDNRVRYFDFTDVEGSTVSVRATDGVVDQVGYVTREGSFVCEGATACAGVTIGALTADDTVPIAFDRVALLSTGGAKVSLTGTLSGAGVLPALPCDTDKLYLIDTVGGGVRGLCLYEGGGMARGTTQEQSTWGSLDFDLPYFLEVVHEGSSVVSVDVWWPDPVTGALLSLYRCEGAACVGATVGQPYDTVNDYGEPVRLRDFALHNVPLVAVDADGHLGDAVTMSVTATLNNRVPPEPYIPDCSASTEHNVVTFSDTTPAIDVCPPPLSSWDYYNYKGASPYYGVPDVLDAVDFSVSTYVLPKADGATSAQNTVHVVLRGDTLLKVFLTTYADARSFSCSGDACAGVTVSAQDAEGQRTIAFNTTLLTQDPVRQVPGPGTTATVTGGFLTLPDPYFVPLSFKGPRAAALSVPASRPEALRAWRRTRRAPRRRP